MSEVFDRLEVLRGAATPLPWAPAHYYDVSDEDFVFLFNVMTEYERIRNETAGFEGQIAALNEALTVALRDVNLKQVRKARLAEAVAASCGPHPTGFLAPPLVQGVYDGAALDAWRATA